MIRVFSYNVLSSELARSDHFIDCSPDHLSSSFRFERLTLLLREEFEKKAIICLQEVSLDWEGKLHVLFANNDYYFVCGMYGNKMNGYMGVGIAYPKNEYDLLKSDIIRVSDTKRRVNLEESFIDKVGCILTLFPGIMRSSTRFEIWKDALDKKNALVMLKLYHRKHDPQFVQDTAKDLPYIFCGDFNIRPDSSFYQLLTSGEMNEQDPAYPCLLDDDDWSPLISPMRSAYKTFQSQEPEFTNYSRTAFDREAFLDTLDYIFLSPHFSVNDVDKLLLKNDITSWKSFPCENQPSDHIHIAANLSL